MGKAKGKRETPSRRLSVLAETLLSEMASAPDRIEYNTRVLGGMFRDQDVARLDEAYEELRTQGYIEPAGAVLSFFGTPKPLFRISKRGLAHSEERAA